jgi:signal transduction histidine kinase
LLGLVFTAGNVLILGLVYWQTSHYLEHRVDDNIHAIALKFKDGDPAYVTAEVRRALAYDLRKSNLYGLFAADGTLVVGNLELLPPVPTDGEIHPFTYDAPLQYEAADGGTAVRGLVRVLARRLPNGEILIIGRDFTQMAEIKSIILDALLWSGVAIAVIILISAFALSVRPLRRINAIRATSRRIVQGELSLRMAVSNRHDELDMLAGIVNLMLDEIERLLTEVKSVSDTLAHDLRTPLTRLCLQLQRAQHQTAPDDPQRQLLDKALLEADALLARFRALLRISEIETRQRKAGFRMVDPREVLNQVEEMFDALAEDKSVGLTVLREPVGPIHADPDLLLEGLSNLVDNAIKFTPAGGSVTIKLWLQDDIARIDVIDTGCGIDVDEREAVLQRFYRGSRNGTHEGHGLGLSIVAAIVRLHGFSLQFHDCTVGAHVSILCSAAP